jgi:hypothetical protein
MRRLIQISRILAFLGATLLALFSIGMIQAELTNSSDVGEGIGFAAAVYGVVGIVVLLGVAWFLSSFLKAWDETEPSKGDDASAVD